jgi:hypothetical protein
VCVAMLLRYSLSWLQHRHKTLGEALEGDHISNSLYNIYFRVPVEWSLLCEVHLNPDEVVQFR